MFYFWNDKQLARDLKNNTTSEKQKFFYLVLYVFISYLRLIISHHSHNKELNIYIDIVQIFCAFAVLYFLYTTNQQGDGIKFIERLICLGPLLYIKMLVLIAIPNFLIELIIYNFNAHFFEEKYIMSAWSLAILIIFCSYFYLRMVILLKIASGQAE